MVVIGIIAILGAVVVPGFKKAYDDFKIRETYALLDSFFSTVRSYYLIHNEFHGMKGMTWGYSEDGFMILSSPSVRKFFSEGEYRSRYATRKFYFRKGLYLFPDKYKGQSYEGQSFHNYGGGLFLYTPCDVYYMHELVERYRGRGYFVREATESVNLAICLPEAQGITSSIYAIPKWFQ